MITPKYLDEIIKGVENVVSDLTEYLIGKIAKRIMGAFTKGEEQIIIPTTVKEINMLKNSGKLVDEIQQDVTKRLPSIEKEVKKAFLESANEIAQHEAEFAKEIVKTLDNNGQPIEVEVPQYEKHGLPQSTKELHMTAKEVRQLEQIYKSTNKTIKNMCKTLPTAGHNAYIDACDRAFMKVQSGISPNTAIIEAIEEMAQAGLKTVTYEKNGVVTKVDSIEVAIARAVRSGINKANAEIVLTRCAELGVGYVKVSAHIGARVTKNNDYTNHAWWQGKVYKLDFTKDALKNYLPTPEEQQQNNNDGFGWMQTIHDAKKIEKDYPDFVEMCGYGDIQGICGVNCRHTFTEYYPDIQVNDDSSIDQEVNKRAYELSQRQRAKEREIRALKKRIAGLEQNTPSEENTKKLTQLRTKLREKNRAYLQFCRDNRLSMQNWRVQV